MSPDLHTLAGAYAVNALPPDERAAYEEHVQACPDCAQEVRELRATAARLAAASARTPPTSLRGRVLAAIAAIRPLPPPAQPVAAAPLPRLMPRLLAAAAAVALLLAGTFGVLALGADRRADRLALEKDRLTEVVLDNDRLTDVLVARDARGIGGQVAGGGQATVMVSRDRGTVVVLADDLAAVADDRDYQVWLIGSGGTRSARSAGLLDPDTMGDAMRLVEAPLADVTAVGLTVEPAGGSERPTTRPVLLLRLPA